VRPGSALESVTPRGVASVDTSPLRVVLLPSNTAVSRLILASFVRVIGDVQNAAR
jgi:hypothetical protein